MPTDRSSTQSFTISVTDVNESGATAITDNDAAADSVAENAVDRDRGRRDRLLG